MSIECYLVFRINDAIPDFLGNFTLNGEYRIGSPDNRVPVQEFVGQHGTYFMSVIATKDDCTPLTLAMYGQNEDQTGEGLHYITTYNLGTLYKDGFGR